MISFTVRMKFAPEDRDKVRTILQNIGPPSRAEAGCVSYVTHFVEGEPCTVLIYEQYADATSLEIHRGSAHFEQFGTNGLSRLMRERSVETLTEVA